MYCEVCSMSQTPRVKCDTCHYKPMSENGVSLRPLIMYYSNALKCGVFIYSEYKLEALILMDIDFDLFLINIYNKETHQNIVKL